MYACSQKRANTQKILDILNNWNELKEFIIISVVIIDNKWLTCLFLYQNYKGRQGFNLLWPQNKRDSQVSLD